MNILVDFSWLCYRNKFAYDNLKAKISGVTYNTGLPYGVFTTLITLLRKFPEATIYIVKDGYPHKKDHYSLYKANRDKTKDTDLSTDLSVSSSLFTKYLNLNKRIKIAYHNYMEADDTIGFLCEALEGSKYIFSTDWDLRQFVSNDKKIFCASSFSKTGFVLEDEKYLMEGQGLKPEAIPMYKTITGDEGDNYFGIPRFKRSLAVSISNEYTTISSLREYLDRGLWKTSKYKNWIKKLEENWKLLELNYYLAKIDPPEVPIIEDYREPTSEDIVDFSSFCNTFGLRFALDYFNI